MISFDLHRPLTYLMAGLLLILVTSSCAGDEESAVETVADDELTEKPDVPIPAFNRDSAYAFVAEQVAFGPRNPGSEGIEAFRDWAVGKLEGYGADVIRQDFTARVYTGESYPSENIIAQFNTGAAKRVLLAAHYDTRFMAEEDADENRKNEPIDGADDGASGVGVLIELARHLKEQPVEMGVDIILFDAEDQGRRGEGSNETWCLGAQYWAKNPHRPGYKARFGILLDMVGAKNAFFNQENVTNLYQHAREVHQLYQKVWNLARAMGKGKYFQNRRVQPIIDDHYFVNLYTGIPMIDIINKPPGASQGFGEHWHTHRDNLDIIDKNTLGAVGQVVTAVVYRTENGDF